VPAMPNGEEEGRVARHGATGGGQHLTPRAWRAFLLRLARNQTCSLTVSPPNSKNLRSLGMKEPDRKIWRWGQKDEKGKPARLAHPREPIAGGLACVRGGSGNPFVRREESPRNLPASGVTRWGGKRKKIKTRGRNDFSGSGTGFIVPATEGGMSRSRPMKKGKRIDSLLQERVQGNTRWLPRIRENQGRRL